MQLQHLFVSEPLKDYQLLYCNRQVLLLHFPRDVTEQREQQRLGSDGDNSRPDLQVVIGG